MSEVSTVEIKTATGNSPIEVFARELLVGTAKELRVVRCKPIDLPKVLSMHETGLLASTSKGDIRWRTIDLHKRGQAKDFVENSNEEEAKLASCAPVALRELGLPVTQDQIIGYSHKYNSVVSVVSDGPRISGHVMAFKKEGDMWVLTDQYGTCKVDDSTLIEIARFRSENNPTAPQGYIVQEENS